MKSEKRYRITSVFAALAGAFLNWIIATLVMILADAQAALGLLVPLVVAVVSFFAIYLMRKRKNDKSKNIVYGVVLDDEPTQKIRKNEEQNQNSNQKAAFNHTGAIFYAESGQNMLNAAKRPACEIKQSEAQNIDWAGRGYDPLLPQAVDVIFETSQASVSMIQRRLKLGYSRAAQLVDRMEEIGIVGPFIGSKPRQILITRDQWLQMVSSFPSVPEKEEPTKLDLTPFVQDEEEWRRARRGLSPLENELYKVDHMAGHDFENWCADLLKRNGFEDVKVTPGSNDQGVDVLAEKGGIKYAVQCKCYSTDLGNTPVQEVNTGKMIYHCHVGAVMTNRYFTQGGKDAAAATGVLLWDRDKLIEMMQ